MFDGIIPKRDIAHEFECDIESTERNRALYRITPEEHARRLRPSRESLETVPGFRGRLIRIALNNGWC
jgi:hypothetical protein